MTPRSDRYGTTWPLTPHTKAKHELLRGYLQAWFPILSAPRSRIIVLDGFAGPGIYDGGEPGSPAIVLDTLLSHSHAASMTDSEFVLVFNEQDGDRFAVLEQVVADLKRGRGGFPSNVDVRLENEDFPALADGILGSLPEGGSLAPTFAFLDPFGYEGISMETIGRLLAFDRCELFIYFDYNSVQRFATAGNVDEHFEALFGSEEYKDAPAHGQPRRKFLHDLYERQLHDDAGFEYVRSFEMVNVDGHTSYYLFFCTRHLLGLDKMKEAMWKVAPSGDFRFDDRYVDQQGLFDSRLDTGPLLEALLEHFAAQTVPIGEVIDYTIEHTPYLSGHVKRRTLKPMEDDGLVTSPSDRKKGTFPDGTLVTFADGSAPRSEQLSF